MTTEDKQSNLLHDRITNLQAALETQHGWNRKQAQRIVELKQQAKLDAAVVARLLLAVRENHDWHLAYDGLDSYPGSALEQINLAALGLPAKDTPQ